MDKDKEKAAISFGIIRDGKGSILEPEDDDYLDMAYEADNEKDALKYARKALKLDNNNVDAEVMIADLTSISAEDLKKKYEKIIAKTEKRMEEQHLFSEENRGLFWGMIETRPYMRLRYAYLRLLVNQGKIKKAIKESEELLGWCENDNMGVRYILISLYALLEDEINVNRLYKQYPEDGVQMLLPIIALYYKMDNYRKANEYLKKLRQSCPDFEDFFYKAINFEDGFNEMVENVFESGMYTPGSKEEVMVTLTDGGILYNCTEGLLTWIVEKIMG